MSDLASIFSHSNHILLHESVIQNAVDQKSRNFDATHSFLNHEQKARHEAVIIDGFEQITGKLTLFVVWLSSE
jgi:hypothetical protein